jgi:polyvinyl alcohol dehydrogenase (cytochrome)
MKHGWLAAMVVLGLGACGKSNSQEGMPDGGAQDATMEGGADAADAASDANVAPPQQPDCGDVTTADWPMWGQNICNTRSAAAGGGLTPDSAKKLAVKWSFDAAGDVSATPAVVGGTVYVPDWGGMLHRIDAATGKATWSKSIGALLGETDEAGAPLDGFASRTTPIVTADGAVVVGTMRQVPQILTDPRPSAFLLAVDAGTGALRWKTPVHEGHPAAVVTGSPVIDGGRLYVGVSSLEEAFAGFVAGYVCCTFRGSVVALDAKTGAVVWQTHTIRDDVYRGADGGPSGYAGGAVWSSTPVVDRKRKQLYVTTGNDYATPAGATGVVDGDYIDSVLALDIDTGAVKWARALGMLDVWTFADMMGPDADFGAGANLFTAMVGGAPKDLVGAGQKNGMYGALDPDTGATVWKTQVGPGGHLGGIQWGTATDGARIYTGVNDEASMPFALGGAGSQSGHMATTGAWGALDPGTGTIVWQIADPALPQALNGATVNGPVSVAGGVVFGGSMDAMGTMFALDAASGDVLWSFPSGGTVYGGPAIAGGVVYWGSGYPSARLGFGTTSKKLYAFAPGN